MARSKFPVQGIQYTFACYYLANTEDSSESQVVALKKLMLMHPPEAGTEILNFFESGTTLSLTAKSRTAIERRRRAALTQCGQMQDLGPSERCQRN